MGYDNNNTGALFKNDRMREGKRDPEYTGSAEVDGAEYWVSAWIRNNPKGGAYDPAKKTFLSLQFTPKQDTFKKQNNRPQSRPLPPPPKEQEDWGNP
jgi:hypothetical protein